MNLRKLVATVTFYEVPEIPRVRSMAPGTIVLMVGGRFRRTFNNGYVTDCVPILHGTSIGFMFDDSRSKRI